MEYNAKRDTQTKLGFLGAMLGLTIQPWETTQILLSKENPRFIFTFLLLLILVIFGPAGYFTLQYGAEAYQMSRSYYYFVIFVLFLVFYMLFFTLYLFILGIEFTVGQLLATVIYSLTPLISLFLIFYTFHYLGSRNFTFLQMVAQGQFTMPQAYVKIIPYLIIITELSVALILAFSIKALAEAHSVSAMLYALVGFLPIAAAAFSTGFVADIINPGSKELVFHIINGIISVWGY
jgi:hypothetical protein